MTRHQVPIRDADGHQIGTADVNLTDGTVTGTITDPDVAAALTGGGGVSIDFDDTPKSYVPPWERRAPDA